MTVKISSGTDGIKGTIGTATEDACKLMQLQKQSRHSRHIL